MLAVGIALLYNYIRSIGAAQALPDERIEAEVEKGMDSGQGTVISDQGKRGRRAILAKRILLYLLIGVVLVGGAAWAPWITRDFAAQRAGEAFTGAWQGVMDGCGLQCKGCGVKEPVKVWFGYWVPLVYACGLLPADTPEYHLTRSVFVSFLGTVHGLDKP